MYCSCGAWANEGIRLPSSDPLLAEVLGARSWTEGGGKEEDIMCETCVPSLPPLRSINGERMVGCMERLTMRPELKAVKDWIRESCLKQICREIFEIST